MLAGRLDAAGKIWFNSPPLATGTRRKRPAAFGGSPLQTTDLEETFQQFPRGLDSLNGFPIIPDPPPRGRVEDVCSGSHSVLESIGPQGFTER